MNDEVKPEMGPWRRIPCPNIDSIRWEASGIGVYAEGGELFTHLPIGSETMIMNRHVAEALGEIDAFRKKRDAEDGQHVE